MKNPIEINLETLTEQVNVKGMKKAELAKHYGLPVTQMTKALKDAGLKIRKFHNPSFVLVTGTVPAPETETAKVEEEAKDTNVFTADAEVATEEIANEVTTANADLAEGPGDTTPVEDKNVSWK